MQPVCSPLESLFHLLLALINLLGKRLKPSCGHAVEIIQMYGRMSGNGKKLLREMGVLKLKVMGVYGDFVDFTNAPEYREVVTERIADGLSVEEAYCGTRANPLPARAHQGVGVQEYGGRARQVRQLMPMVLVQFVLVDEVLASRKWKW